MYQIPVTRALLTAAAVALVGCGGGTSESDVITAQPVPADTVDVVVADTVRMGPDTVAYQAPDTAAYVPRDTVTVMADEPIAAAPHTLQLESVGGAEASGQVTVRQAGLHETEITIALEGGAAAGQRYAGVYRGTCESPGTIVEPLQHVGSDAAGGSVTTLQLPLAQLMAGGHVVIVRADATDQAAPVACATLGPMEGEADGEMDHDQH